MRWKSLLLLALVACGGDATGPDAPWIGDWDAVTVNGRTLPTDVLRGGQTARAYNRKMQILKTSDLFWDDSTTLASGAAASGHAWMTYVAFPDELLATQKAPLGGNAPLSLDLKRQGDGTVRVINSGDTIVFRKR
jgi:hypothetical protein